MNLDHKENMLKAIAGKPTESIPYVPRLDLWYRANKSAGTLPAKYSDSTLMEITDDLGIGYHAVIPDFRDLRSADDDIDRGLGIYNLWFMSHRTILNKVERKISSEGDNKIVEYITPKGKVRTKVLYDDNMRRAGITISHISEYVIRSNEDYEAVGYIFENADVEPNYDGYAKFSQDIGERGLAVSFAGLAGSPMHFILRELMPYEFFFYEMVDHPNQLRKLSEQIGVYCDKVINVVSQSPAELIMVGANYDAAWTPPPFFGEYILPSLKKTAGILHSKGKYVLTHTDGENTGLLEHYINSDIDVADSICPRPMTKLTFKEIREHFNGRITIMGGIPSVALMEATFTDSEFEKFLDDFFGQIGRGDHLILGISDTTPPAAKLDRIVKINERVKAFGAIN